MTVNVPRLGMTLCLWGTWLLSPLNHFLVKFFSKVDYFIKLAKCQAEMLTINAHAPKTRSLASSFFSVWTVQNYQFERLIDNKVLEYTMPKILQSLYMYF